MEKVLSSAPRPLSPGDAMRRVLEYVATGALLAGQRWGQEWGAGGWAWAAEAVAIHIQEERVGHPHTLGAWSIAHSTGAGVHCHPLGTQQGPQARAAPALTVCQRHPHTGCISALAGAAGAHVHGNHGWRSREATGLGCACGPTRCGWAVALHSPHLVTRGPSPIPTSPALRSPGLVPHTCHPSAREPEAGGRSSRPAS